MPPKRLETLFPAITFAIEEYRRIFSCRMARKFFGGIFGYKKKRKTPIFFGALRLAWRFSVGLYDYSAKICRIGRRGPIPFRSSVCF